MQTFNNLHGFLGVVEDRRDPRHLGRVRVRVFNIHPDSKEQVPTEDLPWALVSMGDGTNYKPPIEGSWVFGVFLDGRDAEHPLVLGVVTGMDTGFVDPTQGFTGEHDLYPPPHNIRHPNLSRLATGEQLDQTILAQRYVDLETKCFDYDTPEPQPSYNAQYPYNRVMESESGHVVELDDTPGNERINIHHKSGTFIEVQPNGNFVAKTKGSRFNFVQNNEYLTVDGTANIVVRGSASVKVENNLSLDVDGDLSIDVHGNYSLGVAGQIAINAGQQYAVRASSIRQEASLESIHEYAAVNHVVQAGNSIVQHANTGSIGAFAKTNVTIEATGNYYLYVTGENNQFSGGDYHVEGADLDFNTTGQINNDPVRSTRPFGASEALRSLLGNPPDRRFPVEIEKTDRVYTPIIERDRVEDTEDLIGV